MPDSEPPNSPPPSESPSGSAGGALPSTASAHPSEPDRVMLILSYLFLFALIPLLSSKAGTEVRWHAKQGLLLGMGGGIVVSILNQLGVTGLMGCALWLFLIIVDITAMVKALQGERWRIPLVTEWAEKL